jgi:hypothetical protein
LTRKKVRISDKINVKVASETKDLTEKYNSEKDPTKKLKLQYRIIEKTAKVTMEEIYRLSNRNFGLYMKELTKPFAQQYIKFQQDYIVQRITHGGLNASDLPLVVAEQQIASKAFDRFSPTMAGGDKRVMERTLLLLTMSYAQLGFQLQVMNATLEPLQLMTQMIRSHFGADENWLFAVSILATHENLVKKKLLELGVSEAEIENENTRFHELMERLTKEIEQKENRKLGLGFYKSDTLRTVRNELEHRGYRHKVTREQMLELLKDLKDFEKEVFPTVPAKTS